MTAAAIVKKFDALTKRETKLREEFDALKQEAKKGKCDHSRAREYEVDRDNGYGRWWKEPRRYCQICATTFYRNGLDGGWKALVDES